MPWKKDNTYGPEFLSAKAGATLRSGGVCQFCGKESGTHGHHWAMRYPKPEDLTADDITLLCPDCHRLATKTRKRGHSPPPSSGIGERYDEEKAVLCPRCGSDQQMMHCGEIICLVCDGVSEIRTCNRNGRVLLRVAGKDDLGW